MNLKPIAKNMNELEISNDLKILFSYNTPVAIQHKEQFYVTDKFHSKTTSRHISTWTFGEQTKIISQLKIARIVTGNANNVQRELEL